MISTSDLKKGKSGMLLVEAVFQPTCDSKICDAADTPFVLGM